MTSNHANPIIRPCDSLEAKLWIEFAKEFIKRVEHPSTAAKNADEMVRLFLGRYPAKQGGR